MGVLATALGTLVGPSAPHLGSATSGDTALAARVRAVVGDPKGYRGLSVALIENGQVRYAGLGAAERDGDRVPDPDTPFEIGSITKALTGMLLADLDSFGTARPDDRLGTVLPGVRFADDRLADTTLAELASHRAGLPSVKITSAWQAVAAWARQVSGGDPYAGQDVAWVRDATAGSQVGSWRGEMRYSNFGFAVLGLALAERTGTAYPDLLRRRVLDPLGMPDTTVHSDGATPPARAAEGSGSGGQRRTPWSASGYAPAGSGVWSTARDLATLLSAVMAGTAPGASATSPRFNVDENTMIGYGWITTKFGDTQLVWHNGGTGGFRSFLAFDPQANRAVVVLSNTDRAVDPIGVALLRGAQSDDGSGDSAGDPGPARSKTGRDGGAIGPVIAALIMTFAGGLSLLAALRNRFGRRRDRLDVLSGVVWALAGPAIAYQLNAWAVVPTVIWALGAGLTVAALVLAAGRWLGLAWPARGTWLTGARWAGFALSTALASTLAFGLAWSTA